MDVGQVIVWALCIGIAVNLFFSLTGLGTILSRMIRNIPDADDFLILKIRELENRIGKLESNKSKVP